MNAQILVALLSLAGTIIGSFAGIFASARLTTYRLKQLEKKVDMHNNFAARMPVVEEQIKEINRRLDIYEEDIK